MVRGGGPRITNTFPVGDVGDGGDSLILITLISAVIPIPCHLIQFDGTHFVSCSPSPPITTDASSITNWKDSLSYPLNRSVLILTRNHRERSLVIRTGGKVEGTRQPIRWGTRRVTRPLQSHATDVPVMYTRDQFVGLLLHHHHSHLYGFFSVFHFGNQSLKSCSRVAFVAATSGPYFRPRGPRLFISQQLFVMTLLLLMMIIRLVLLVTLIQDLLQAAVCFT